MKGIKIGIVGVSSDLNTYGGQSMRDAREVLYFCMLFSFFKLNSNSL